MKKSDVVRFAYEAGCKSIIVPDEWFRFAKLVAAAKREWQGLTDEEVTACWKDGFDSCEQKTVADLRDFIARAIEAKLREKNT